MSNLNKEIVSRKHLYAAIEVMNYRIFILTSIPPTHNAFV